MIVWGATGFTGTLISQYLVREYLKVDFKQAARKLRFALAGRNKKKLEQLKTELSIIDSCTIKNICFITPDLVKNIIETPTIIIIYASIC